MRNRVLFVCHNHPAVRPGGTEIYALALHRAMRASPDFEPVFLARAEALSAQRHRGGTVIAMAGREADEYLFYTSEERFDAFLMRQHDPSLWTRSLRDFLTAYRPDVVHFQHTLLLGYDMIREVRNTLPQAALVYTLHEFIGICHRQGQMVRATEGDALCTDETPRRCNECFPHRSPQDFLLRKRFIQAHLTLIDMFIAPSHFVLDRYRKWGLPAEKLMFEENGMATAQPPATPQPQRQVRNRLGFFGQMTRYKGLHTLLQAMQMLRAEQTDVHLTINGANLSLEESQYRHEISRLLEACAGNVTFNGAYPHEQLPRLMAEIDWVVVPSIWWENSPLVIQEAFRHGRPVICADIGGMAEKVTHGQTGLHFQARNPVSLAAVIKEAVGSAQLWSELSRNLPSAHGMPQHVARLTDLYRDLLHRRRGMDLGLVEVPDGTDR